jgi:hypothetical protein
MGFLAKRGGERLAARGQAIYGMGGGGGNVANAHTHTHIPS